MKAGTSRVLYIDDSESNLFLVQLMMEDAGVTMESATTGEEGVGKISTQKYHLILTDIHLPTADGFEVLSHVRRKGSLNEFTPVVAFTADVTVESRKEIAEAGFTDFIGKPFKPDDLMLLLNVFLSDIPLESPDFSYYEGFLKTIEERGKLKNFLQIDFESFEKEIGSASNSRNWSQLRNALHRIEFNCSNLLLNSFLQSFKIIRAEGGFTPTTNNELKKVKRDLLRLYPYFN